MNSFDTVHLLVPVEGLNGYDSASFTEKAELDEAGKPVSSELQLKRGAEKPLGLAGVKITDAGVDLTLSAKTLGSRYIEGLSEETLGLAVSAIRPLVDVELDALLDADLYRVDSTSNIRPTDVRRAILSVGTLGQLNGKYRLTDYGGQGEDGFVFTARAKSRDERLSGYDKMREMLSRKKTAYTLGVENFEGVLRIESNIRHREQMREFLGLSDSYMFRDALRSEKKPNLILFDKIIGNGSDMLAEMNRIHRTEGIGVKHFQNIGIDRVIELHGGNWKAIEKYVLLQYGGKSKPSRLLKQVKQRVVLYHARQREAENLLDEVSEVRELLRVA